MAEINYALEQNYKSYFSTFKDTSEDDNDKSKPSEYLCMDTSQTVINFDEIVKYRYPDPDDRPKSFDAVYIYKNKVYCIEFKNQKNPNNREVIGKLVEGKRELDKILGEINVQKDNYAFIYCLVHKNCKPHFNRYKCGIEKGRPRFSLLKYKQNGFIDDIFTEDVIFFTEQFKDQTLKELAC